MNRLERSNLASEQQFLREQIAALPDRARMTRRSLESRLETVMSSLEQAGEVTREPARAVLTFRGLPVLGTHGVMADFGATATKAFSDAVSAVAASVGRPLAAMGRIPNRDQNRLLITGTALGSFGFELEEVGSSLVEAEQETPVEIALEKTQRLLESTTGTDEQLADTLSEVDPRAVEKVKGFLAVLADAEATCAFEQHGRRFVFSNVEQVATSLGRLSSDNIHEENVRLRGVLQGVLPGRRQFEFLADGEEQPVFGTISPLIEQPGVLTGQWGNRFDVEMTVTRVGNGRPRYVLREATRVDD
jgi:hypothetical protein